MSQRQITGLWFLVTTLAVLGTGPSSWAARYDGKLKIEVADEVSGKPIAVRMELQNSRGRPVRVRAEGAISRDGYIVFEGQIALELKKGDYRFTIEAGPEYRTRSGHFTIERHAEDVSSITLRRHVDMRKQGWWAGDLDDDSGRMAIRKRSTTATPTAAAKWFTAQQRAAATIPDGDWIIWPKTDMVQTKAAQQPPAPPSPSP